MHWFGYLSLVPLAFLVIAGAKTLVHERTTAEYLRVASMLLCFASVSVLGLTGNIAATWALLAPGIVLLVVRQLLVRRARGGAPDAPEAPEAPEAP